MFNITSRRIEDVTPHRAESLLKLNTLDGQRPMNMGVAKMYADEMKRGAWRTSEIGIARKVFNGGHEVLANGQKQLQAIILSGKTVSAFIERADCSTEEDMWQYFARWDVNQIRTNAHVVKAARNLLATETLRMVPLDLLNSCASALQCLGAGTTPVVNAKVSKADRVALLDQYADEVLWVYSFYSICERRRLQIPVIVVMLATRRANAKKAQAFWERAIGGDQLVRKSPQWHANRIVWSTPNSRSGKIGVIDRFKELVSWWNSYITGEPRNAVKVASMKELPRVIG